MLYTSYQPNIDKKHLRRIRSQKKGGASRKQRTGTEEKSSCFFMTVKGSSRMIGVQQNKGATSPWHKMACWRCFQE